jgi:hypothetical protein
MARAGLVLLLAALLCVAAVAVSGAAPPRAHAANTCADYPNQAAAQRAHDTRDSDHDGIYCESLPCPCLKPGAVQQQPAPVTPKPSCVRIHHIVSISFSATKYAHIRAHYLRALKRGWPRILVLNRSGADARRARLLASYPTRPAMDRDEYPPSVGRGRGTHLERGSNPRGWMADVEYVASSENRSHGATMGIKLRRFCSGQRWRYLFY